MTKYQRLTKKTVKAAVLAAVVLGIFGGIYGGLSYYADSVAQQKSEASSRYDQDVALLNTLHNQLEKSGEAQKRYAALQAERTSMDFAANIGAIKQYLSSAKSRYHFDHVSLKPAKEVPTDKPELANFSYNIMLQPHMTMQFLAPSDVHVFSFIDDLRRSAPGLIRIDSVKLKRVADMTEAVFGQMSAGMAPNLVDATVEFTWIHVTPKDTKDPNATAPGTAH